MRRRSASTGTPSLTRSRFEYLLKIPAFSLPGSPDFLVRHAICDQKIVGRWNLLLGRLNPSNSTAMITLSSHKAPAFSKSTRMDG